MEKHKVKLRLIGLFFLLTVQSFPEAARQHKVDTHGESAVPSRVPLLQKRHEAVQHGRWSHIRSIASSDVSLPAKIVLSAQDPCGSQISPLCPKQEEQQGPTPDGSAVTGAPTQAPGFKIFVVKGFNRTPSITLSVKAEDTIQKIKAMIANAGIQLLLLGFQSTDLEESQYRLLFKGSKLEDNFTLDHYNIVDGDTLHLFSSDLPNESADTTPDGNELKPGQAPVTDAPCETKPPCQRTSLNCDDVNSVTGTPHVRGLALKVNVPSICLLIFVILMSFEFMW